MMTFLLFFHVAVCALIILLVLVQQGKGATMGAAFGSGASQTVFGSRGSGSFLLRLTLIFGALFFINGIALNYFTMQHAKTLRHETPINLPTNVATQIPVSPSQENLGANTNLPISDSVLSSEKAAQKK